VVAYPEVNPQNWEKIYFEGVSLVLLSLQNYWGEVWYYSDA
jgi:hypothetical protein